LTTFSSVGYFFSSTRLLRSDAIRPAAFAAAPDASITVSGISFGPEKEPQTYIPGWFVLIGENLEVSQNPNSLSFIPNLSASSLTPSFGSNPTDRTTILNSSSLILPSSLSYLINKLLVLGSSCISDILHRMNLTPYSSFALL